MVGRVATDYGSEVGGASGGAAGGDGGPSGAPLSLVTVQAGRAKIVLAIMKSQSTIRVRIRQMIPDLTEVGSSLEEAKALRQEHDELIIKLNMKQREVGQALTLREGGSSDNGTPPEKILEQLSDAWKDVTKQLECRKMLLDQSVAFHTSALQLNKKMGQVEEKCKTTTIAHDVETARRLLQQHQEMKKGVLEASMNTLQEGQLLLERIRKMATCADVSNRHATTSACYGIEQQLLRLQDRKRRLEELWFARRQQLTLCIQMLLVEQKAAEITKWIESEAEPLTNNKDLGESSESAARLQNEFLDKFNACLDKHDELQRLIGRAEFLVNTALPQKTEVKNRLNAMLGRCDNLVSAYIARRVNLIQSYKFFILHEEAMTRLEDIEVLAMRTDRTGDELLQRHTQLYQQIIDVSVEPIYLGQVLVRRLGRETPSVSVIAKKLTELQDRCRKLEEQCTAFNEHGKKQEALHQIECKLKKLSAWEVRVARTRSEEELDIGKTQHMAQQYPLYNKEFAAECKDKQLDAKSLLTAAETLAKTTAEKKASFGEGTASSDEAVAAAVAASAAEGLLTKVKTLSGVLDELVTVSEKKAKLNRTLILYHIKTHQLYALMDLVEELIRVEKDPSHISEATVKHKEDVCKSLAPLAVEVERITKQFTDEVAEAKLDDNLEPALISVQSMAPYYTQRNKLLTQFYEHWKVFVTSGREFNVQWKQFVVDARRTIDWVLKVEHDFFPKLAGELGTNLAELKAHERRLDEFKPTIKKVQEDIEKHLKAAEMISLKGDTRGQRDQVINELLKVHTRFQARVGEYRFLINMATKFFENLSQLDKLIETTEKEYRTEVMPKEVGACEKMLLEHEASRTKLKQYIDFSTEEADQIITRVRQQDSESDAREGVQKLLQLAEGKRKEWDDAWDDHKRRLEQSFLVSQLYFDLKKLQDELDELQKNLVSRHGNYGSSLSAVKMTSQAFQAFEKAADEIEGKVKNFMSTADRMIKDRHYDSRRVRHEVDDTEKKWIQFYNTIKSYRMALDDSAKFFELMDGCEGWLVDAAHFLLGISKRAPDCKTSDDVDGLIGEIEKFRLDGSTQQDGRLNDMERIATDLYGQVGGPEKMQNILDKNHEMFNAFVKAIEDLAILRNNLMKTEQIIAGMDMGTGKKKGPRQPRFVTPLQNAEISEGQSFTLECRLECDSMTPLIEWTKENEPVKGFIAAYKDGLCQLHISETMLADSAKYVCKATTDGGTAETSAVLKVKVAQQKVVTPEFTKHLRAADVPEGTSYTLECLVSGIPFPTITWYKDNVPIVNNADYLMTIDNGRCLLKIRKMTKPLSGNYSCKASNPGGDVTSSATVNAVAVRKPEFTEPLKDTSTVVGKPVRLECKYVGEPAPQIQWMVNDKPLFPSGIFKITVEDTFTALDIQQVYPEDCGSYTAIAKNLGGEARTSCLLSLDSALPPSTSGRAPCKPEFIEPLQHRDIQEGGRVRLECVCTGFPEPEIEWYHNEKLVKKGGKDFELSYDHGRCALLIQEVYLEDSGDYVCVAKNMHGSAKTKCRIIVEPLSELSDASASAAGEVPPKFTQLLKDIEGIEGELVCFECRVIGHPTPVIKWYRGRNQIQSTPEFEIKSERELQTLTIPKAYKEDAGNYMVKATNDAGVAKCYATLLVKPGGEKHGMKMRLVESSHTMPGMLAEGHHPPTITRAFHDFTVRQGKPCSMEVIIVGRPQPKVQWLFNNEPVVTPDYKISAFGDTHILHIPEVMEEDAGRFSVVAENESGKAWCSALLVVVDESQLVPGEGSPPETPQGGFFAPSYGPPPVVQRRPPRPTKADHTSRPPPVEGPPVAPEFVQNLKNLTASEGTQVTFEGVVAGRPEPIVRWFKDGRALSGPAAIDFEFVQLPGGQVRLTIPAAKESDAGRYTCMANSSGGEASSTAELTVKSVSTAPVFAERLQTSEVKEGEPVRFRVRLSGKPAPTVTWYRNGVQIESSADFHVTQHGDIHSLYIPEVFYEDAGKFTVKARNPGGEIQCTAELIVEALSDKEDYATSASPFSRSPSQDPSYVSQKSLFTKPLFNRAVQVGQRVTLECSIPAEPGPERIQWYHNEIEIHPSPTHQMSYANGVCSLTLTSAQPDMRGRYVCTVTIRNARGTTDMHLDVLGEPVSGAPDRRPEFDDKLKNVQASVGYDATFFCRVQAQPMPQIQWLLNGRPIHPSARHEIKLGRDGSCFLRVRNVQPSDAGVYTCTATNNLGQGSSAAELSVQPSGPSVDETSYVESAGLRRVGGRAQRHGDRGVGGVAEQYYKPVFQKIPADIDVAEGQMARFDSVVSGRPIPDMLWFRDGTQVFSDLLHKIVINEEGINSLIFDATVPQDAGLYTCIAQNRAGEDRFQVRLNIHRRPVTSVPRFISHMTNQNVYEGQGVTFTAEVEGIPPPKVSWQKDGRHIEGDSHYRIHTESGQSTLHIPSVRPEDNAWFECTASSPAGTATHRARLIVQVEPRDERSQSATRVTLHHTSQSPSRGRTMTPGGTIMGSSPTPPPYHSLGHSETTVSRTTTVSGGYGGGRPTDGTTAPQLLEPMKDVQVNEGGSAHFRCKIFSQTEPLTEWFFNNRPLYPSARHQIVSRGDGVYTLDMPSVSPGDAGIYKCVVSNQGGEVTCIAHLRVGSATPSMRAEHYARDRSTPDQYGDGWSGSRQQTSGSGSRQATPGVGQRQETPTMRAYEQSEQRMESEANRMQAELTAASKQPMAPRFVSLMNDVNAASGRPARFECTVSGYPAPEDTWFREGHQIQPSKDFQIRQDGDRYTLIITEAMPEDTGLITCRATNASGTRESSARLNVQAAGNAPRFIKPLQSLTAVDGTEVTLSCVVIGQPAPEVTWYHNDASLANSKDFIISYTPETGLAQLIIVDCMMDDQGTFKCVARNTCGQSETAASLTVNPDNKQSQVRTQAYPDQSLLAGTVVKSSGSGTMEFSGAGEAPKFIQPIQPCVVVEGQNCIFSAIVGGDPFPEVTWLKEKQDLVLTERYRSVVNRDTGMCQLYIYNCVMSDTGVYSCRASNSAGRATCTANVVIVPPNVEVTVTEKTMSVKKEKVTTMGDQETRVIENSPTFTEALLPIIEVDEGEPIRLQCQVSSEPPPNIFWFFNGSQLTSSSHVTLAATKDSTSLSITSTSLADTGEYMCKANNVLGEAVTRTFLRVRKVEKEPGPRVPAPQRGDYSTVVPVHPHHVVSAGSAVEVSLPPGSLAGPPSGRQYAGDDVPRAGSPKFTMPLRNQAVRDGEPVWFTVQVRGDPFPTITWFSNGQPVLIDGDFQIRTDTERGESTLFIREAFPEDEGEFTCRAENPQGTAITNSHLFIVESPVDKGMSVSKMFQVSSRSFSLDRSNNLDISTEEQNKKNLSSLVHANIEQKKFGPAHIDSLFIPIDVYKKRKLSASLERHEGRRESYTTCLLRQIDSHRRSESEPPSPQRFSETVSIDSTDEKAHTFEFRLLSERKKTKVARLNAYRAALPRGMKLEAEILDLKRSLDTTKTSHMDITRAKYAEAVASQRRELLIQLDGAAPRFVQELVPQTVMDGSRAKFACKVFAKPMPDKVVWFHDNKQVPLKSPDVETVYDFRSGEAVLVIGEVFPQDAGQYECIAANIHGKSSARSRLHVEAYEYLPDSEESYTSQTESVVSRNSSHFRSSAAEFNSNESMYTEQITMSKRENMENTEILNVEWQKRSQKEIIENTEILNVEWQRKIQKEDIENTEIMNVEWQKPKVVTPRTEIQEAEQVEVLKMPAGVAADGRVISSEEACQRTRRSVSESRVQQVVAIAQIEHVRELVTDGSQQDVCRSEPRRAPEIELGRTSVKRSELTFAPIETASTTQGSPVNVMPAVETRSIYSSVQAAGDIVERSRRSLSESRVRQSIATAKVEQVQEFVDVSQKEECRGSVGHTPHVEMVHTNVLSKKPAFVGVGLLADQQSSPVGELPAAEVQSAGGRIQSPTGIVERSRRSLSESRVRSCIDTTSVEQVREFTNLEENQECRGAVETTPYVQMFHTSIERARPTLVATGVVAPQQGSPVNDLSPINWQSAKSFFPTVEIVDRPRRSLSESRVRSSISTIPVENIRDFVVLDEQNACRREPETTPQVDLARTAIKRLGPTFVDAGMIAPQQSSPVGVLSPVESQFTKTIFEMQSSIVSKPQPTVHESRVRSSVHSTTVEQVRDLRSTPETADGQNLVGEAPMSDELTRPAVRRVGPTFTPAGHISQEIARVEELPKLPSSIYDAGEIVKFQGEARAHRERPSSWSFTMFMIKDEARSESAMPLISKEESRPALERSLEKRVESNLTVLSAVGAKKPTLVKQSVEFHSEGEEEDIYHEVAEPCLTSEPFSDSKIIAPVPKVRPVAQTVPLIEHRSCESTGPGPQPFTTEAPQLNHVATSPFVRVDKKLPLPKLAVVQNIESSLIIAVVEEYSSPRGSPKMTKESLPPWELDKAETIPRKPSWSLQQYCLSSGSPQIADELKLADAVAQRTGPSFVQTAIASSPPLSVTPINLVKPVVEHQSPQTVLVSSPIAPSVENAQKMDIQEVAKSTLVRTEARKVPNMTQQMLAPESRFDIAREEQLRVNDISVSPSLIYNQFVSTEVSPKTVTRAIVSEGKASVGVIVRLDQCALIISPCHSVDLNNQEQNLRLIQLNLNRSPEL